jgi:tetratricopeptide (TPR) repeat protein
MKILLEKVDDLDIDEVERLLRSVNEKTKPLEWATLMNVKGMLCRNEGFYEEAEDAFKDAKSLADDTLKSKIIINHAKSHFFAGRKDRALKISAEYFELCKENKKLARSIYTAYAHLLRGRIYYKKDDEKGALNELKKAEFYFENSSDTKGVALSCMELARVHLSAKNLTTAWNYLRKGENFLRMSGDILQARAGRPRPS